MRNTMLYQGYIQTDITNFAHHHFFSWRIHQFFHKEYTSIESLMITTSSITL